MTEETETTPNADETPVSVDMLESDIADKAKEAAVDMDAEDLAKQLITGRNNKSKYRPSVARATAQAKLLEQIINSKALNNKMPIGDPNDVYDLLPEEMKDINLVEEIAKINDKTASLSFRKRTLVQSLYAVYSARKMAEIARSTEEPKPELVEEDTEVSV